MILITKQSSEQFDQKLIEIITDFDEAKAVVQRVFENAPVGYGGKKYVAIDTETNSLDPIIVEVLLTSISDSREGVVIDCTTFDIVDLLPEDYQEYVYIGQNIKYDCGVLYSERIQIPYTWDTMSMDQKIYQGVDDIKFNLVALCQRYLNHVPQYMDKDTRMDFVRMSKSYAPFETRHVLYSGTDVLYLHEIMNKQISYLEKIGLMEYYKLINMELHDATASMEVEGFNFNSEKWIENIEYNETEAFNKAVELDKLVLKLRNEFFVKDGVRLQDYFSLVGGKFTNVRKRHTRPSKIGLFGEEVDDKDYYGTKKPKFNVGNTNWNSPNQVVKIFAKLKLDLPTDHKDISYAVPQLVTYKKIGKNGNSKLIEEVDQSEWSYCTGKDEIEEMIISRPDHSGIELLRTLREYRGFNHNVTGFGYNFIKNLHNNKIYSCYRTDVASTGRFQSGGGKDILSNKFNNHNIPKDNRFRTCFGTTSEYSITTCDLSGAEVVIMCDKAHDEHLYEIAVIKDDVHSPIATQCWRNIYQFRAGVNCNLWYTASDWKAQSKIKNLPSLLSQYSHPHVQRDLGLSLGFTISKSQNVDLRTQFKNVTFATVYRAMPKKIGKMLNISVEEATIVWLTIREELKDTFSMIDANVEFAINNGYLVLNHRTNSRIVYKPVIDAITGNYELDWGLKSVIEGSAANAPIQGTQADMIKESIIEIHRFIRNNKLKCRLMGTVHDENIVKQPKDMDGISNEWMKSKNWVPFTFDSHHDPDRIHDWLFRHKEECQRHIVKTESWTKGNMQLRVSFPMFIKLTMCNTAWRYLDHYLMGAEFVVDDTWRK